MSVEGSVRGSRRWSYEGKEVGKKRLPLIDVGAKEEQSEGM